MAVRSKLYSLCKVDFSRENLCQGRRLRASGRSVKLLGGRDFASLGEGLNWSSEVGVGLIGSGSQVLAGVEATDSSDISDVCKLQEVASLSCVVIEEDSVV